MNHGTGAAFRAATPKEQPNAQKQGSGEVSIGERRVCYAWKTSDGVAAKHTQYRLAYDDGDGPQICRWKRLSVKLHRGDGGDKALREYLDEKIKLYLKADSPHAHSYKSVPHPFDWSSAEGALRPIYEKGVQMVPRGDELGSLGGHVATGDGASTLHDVRSAMFEERSQMRTAAKQAKTVADGVAGRSGNRDGTSTVPAVAAPAVGTPYEVGSASDLNGLFLSSLPAPLQSVNNYGRCDATRRVAKAVRIARNEEWAAEVSAKGVEGLCTDLGIDDPRQISAIQQWFFEGCAPDKGSLYSDATRRAFVSYVHELASADAPTARLEHVADVQPLMAFLLRDATHDGKLSGYNV